MTKRRKFLGWTAAGLLCLAAAGLPLAAQTTLEADWIFPRPNATPYRAVWGTSPSDLFLAGRSGLITHYDGSNFTNVAVPSTADVYEISALWGSSASDVYAVGSSYSGGGLILRYDGSAWSDITPADTVFWLNGVWGAGPSAVFAVGDSYWDSDLLNWNNSILFFNGSSWTPMELGTYVNLNAVWGASASDVFAVGDSGAIYHYDGGSWGSMTSPTGASLNSVWGASGTDVFAVGSNGTILHYDGSGWSAMTSGVTNTFYGVWGENGGDVYAVGSGGIICHWNGASWNSGFYSGNYFFGICGFSGTPYFAAGQQGRVYRYQSGAWSQITPTTTLTSQSLNGIWGSSESNIYAMGSNGNIFHFNGSTWNNESIYGSTTFYRIWGLAADDIYAVGGDWEADPDRWQVYHFDGGSWSLVASGDGYILYDVWGSASVDGAGKANDVYAVGGTINVSHPPDDEYTILHYDGTSWSVADSGSGFHATGIWGSASLDGSGRADDVFVCGQHTNASGGYIRRFDGSSWSTSMVSGTQLMDLWGSPEVGADGKADDVYAVGYNGGPYHFDGTWWSALDSTYMNSQAWAAWGTGVDQLFVAGSSGATVFDGNAWTGQLMMDPNSNRPLDIWGTADDNIYAVGQSGTIIHLSADFQPPQPPPPPPPQTNEAPVAVISGETFFCLPPQVVSLDGSASSDADGTVMLHSWELISRPGGSAAELSASTGSSVTFTADLAGHYTVTLRVQDDEGAWSSPATHTVTVSAGDPPTLAIQGTRQEDRGWIIRREYAELALTFTPPSSDCARVISGYCLQRSDGAGPFITVKDLDPGDFTLQNGVWTYALTDKYLEKGHTYVYRLAALDPSGQEAASATFSL